MQQKIPIGISLPGEIISKIDSERGDVSRSRYLLRIVETGYRESKSKAPILSKEKNSSDSLGSRFESLRPSEPRDAKGGLNPDG